MPKVLGAPHYKGLDIYAVTHNVLSTLCIGSPSILDRSLGGQDGTPGRRDRNEKAKTCNNLTLMHTITNEHPSRGAPKPDAQTP